MNPARDFGPKLFAFLAGWGDVAMTGGRDNPYFWVPILGPIVGAQIGTALFMSKCWLLCAGQPCCRHRASSPNRQRRGRRLRAALPNV